MREWSSTISQPCAGHSCRSSRAARLSVNAEDIDLQGLNSRERISKEIAGRATQGARLSH